MELLFKRNQTPGKLTRVNFSLWGKIELNEDETTILKRYRFDEAVLIEAMQPTLVKKSIFIGIGVFILVFGLFSSAGNTDAAFVIGLLTAGGTGYWYFTEKRETIFVRDLIHGRNFKCESVVELARKEAWLTTVVSFLRQTMESAKQWDGTEKHTIEPLPKDEARQVILKGI